MKYVVVLRSRYTGDEIPLGSAYDSRDSAEEYVKQEVCLRCNGYEIRTVPDEWMWLGKQRGFGVGKREQE